MLDLSTQKQQFIDEKYAIVRGVVDGPALNIIQRTLKHHFIDIIQAGNLKLGDNQVDKRWVGPRWPISESILTGLKDVVQEIVGRPIVPSYSYSALYVPGAVLRRHVDRHACELTCTLTIENYPDSIWPIYINDPTKGRDHSVRADLVPGDLMVYHGTRFPHWRDAQEDGHYNMSIFLHYMYVDSPIIQHLQEHTKYVHDVNLEDAAAGKRPPGV